MYLVSEVFQKREFKDMLAISYLVFTLQACILFLRRFRQKWRNSVLIVRTQMPLLI